MEHIKLNNGTKIPIIGLGTFRSKGDDAYNATLAALKAGYTHIDTASIYGNEEQIGRAIKDSGLNREDLFITTKLWNTDQGYESTLTAFKDSLKRLDLEYVDLYLIHWFKSYEKSLNTYKALEKLYEDGLIKAIGVSNYNVHHIMHLLEHATVVPTVNQVETHVALQNHFLQEFCEQNGIVLEAYAPFMSTKIAEMLQNEVLNKLAKKHNKTVPQIVLRWFVQRGVVAIPKSITPSRIMSNFDVFDFILEETDMEEILKLNKGTKFFPEMDNISF
jgi:diketogulonate reductase-like aldo/keto reductase